MKTLFALMCKMVESGPRSHISDKRDTCNTEHEVNVMIYKKFREKIMKLGIFFLDSLIIVKHNSNEIRFIKHVRRKRSDIINFLKNLT